MNRRLYLVRSPALPPEPDISASTVRPLFENQVREKWLNTQEAADYLRISTKRLLNLCSNGKIPHYKFGRSNRYLESDLRRLLLAEPRGEKYGN